MELKDGMKVQSPCDGGCGIKKNDIFEVYNVLKPNKDSEGRINQGFYIRNKEGYRDIFCIIKNCAHLKNENWIIL